MRQVDVKIRRYISHGNKKQLNKDFALLFHGKYYTINNFFSKNDKIIKAVSVINCTEVG